MTETELHQILERLERLEAEVRQLKEAVRQFIAAKAETAPAGDAMALHEPTEPYATEPTEKKIIPTAHPHIVCIPGVQGGTPIVRGAYKTVWGIVELFHQGRTPEQIVEDKGEPLTLAQVYDALSYYYDNKEEIEGIISRQNAAMEEARQWAREREAERTAASPR